MKKRSIAFVILFVGLITLFGLIACGEKKGDASSTVLVEEEAGKENLTTLKILCLFHPKADMGLITNAKELYLVQQTQTNEYLADKGKAYRIQIEVQQADYETFEHYDEYNVVMNVAFDMPKELVEEKFLNLADELEKGNLRMLYESEPETYWESVKEESKIFNPYTSRSEQVDAICFNKEELEKLNISMEEIEALKGKPLAEWRGLLEEIYEQVEHKPFITNLNGMQNEIYMAILSDFNWDAHFQMVAPMIGISYDEPEKGAQFVLDSDYAKNMLTIWKEYFDKGYIIDREELKNGNYVPLVSFADTMDTELIEITAIGAFFGYLEPIEKKVPIIICPLQEKLFLNGRNAWEYHRYAFMIPKNQANLDMTFCFLNELVQEEELMKSFCFQNRLGGEGQVIKAAPILRQYGFESYLKYPEKRSEAAQRTEVPRDTGFIYNASTEVCEKAASYFQGIGFVVGPNSKGTEKRIFLDSKENWATLEKQVEAVKREFYEAGVEEVLKEVNEQLERYRAQWQ